MKTEKIYTQHGENTEWMNNVAFYRDEIRIMESRLEEIVSKNTAKETLKQVEHFQNQLMLQKFHLDELEHEINLSNDSVRKEIEKNSIALEHRKIKDHSTAREEMKTFERIYTPLKKDFNSFIGKWI